MRLRRLIALVLLHAALTARAAAPRLIVPGVTPAPAAAPLACPLILPGVTAATPLTPAAPTLGSALILSAGITPTLAPAPALTPAAPAAATAKDSRRAIDDAKDIAAAKDENFSNFFDGVTTPVPTDDGAPVAPGLVGVSGASLGTQIRREAVRRAVEGLIPALRESVSRGNWNGPDTTLDESCCGDAAPKLAAMLRAKGVPARLVEAEFHYYVMVESGEDKIVVDPSVRQFFGKKKAPLTVPTVFVGTIEDLTRLYESHRIVKSTRYEPSRIYFSEAVQREAKLQATLEAIRTNPAAEYEPLRRALGLPSLAPPPAEPPRLIVP